MTTKDDEEMKFAFNNMLEAATNIRGIIFLALIRKNPERAKELSEFIETKAPHFVLQVHATGLDLFAFDEQKNQLGGPVFSYVKDGGEDAPAYLN